MQAVFASAGVAFLPLSVYNNRLRGERVNAMAKKREERKKPSLAYRFVKALIRLFYPRTRCVGAENIPGEPVVFIGNHAQLHGPIACELYMPVDRYTWCVADVMDRHTAPAYMYKDFWPVKRRGTCWFYHLLSYMITPLTTLLFSNADTVPVYHDVRLLDTLRRTTDLLEQGHSIVIFPERDGESNGVLNEFQEGFSDVAKFYRKRTGKDVCFVPMYLAPTLKLISFGEPLRADPDASVKAERESVSRVMTERITALANALPLHDVITYRKMPKKHRPKAGGQ